MLQNLTKSDKAVRKLKPKKLITCDQMSRLLVQYLALFAQLHKNAKEVSKLCQILNKPTKNQKWRNFVKSCHAAVESRHYYLVKIAFDFLLLRV